jgi:hypothetical protein
MATSLPDRLLHLVAAMDPLMWLLWLGLVALTVALLLLMRTRWGQARPLRKCMVLSLLAHLLLGLYTTTVHLVTYAPLQAKEPAIPVRIAGEEIGPSAEPPDTPVQEKPWESFVHESTVRPAPTEPARAEPVEMPPPERPPRPEQAGLSGDPPLDSMVLPEVAPPQPEALPTEPLASSRPTTPSDSAAQPIDVPRPQRRPGPRTELPDQPQAERRPYVGPASAKPERSSRAGLPSSLLEQPLAVPRLTDVPSTPQPESSLSGLVDSLTSPPRGKPVEWPGSQPSETPTPPEVGSSRDAGATAQPTDQREPPPVALRGDPPSDAQDPDEAGAPGTLVTQPLLPPEGRARSRTQIPPIYSLRLAPDRFQLAQLRGATPETEAAVQAALAWLAENQASDGHWDAKAHGAGRELLVAGRDRQSAGLRADTGMTGLALLAFLASGHTHLDGSYQSNVRRALEYLLSVQAGDGNLGGQASTYARMYCHAMATCALSETLGMTGDDRLREPLYRAVKYTLAAQDPVGGGWRYNPNDTGDTSQLGWQLMALRSAELAGIPIPARCRQGALRFLAGVSSGRHGGLAAYRAGQWPSRPMTAEALACRQFLGLAADDAVAEEAGSYLLGELPGEGRTNLYYWYYGTLGMYYLQGESWERWNAALQRTLLGRQRKGGPLGGSWDPDTVWGGYGGRVYSTTVASLCLEVYYRYLPLYLEATRPRRPLR